MMGDSVAQEVELLHVVFDVSADLAHIVVGVIRKCRRQHWHPGCSEVVLGAQKAPEPKHELRDDVAWSLLVSLRRHPVAGDGDVAPGPFALLPGKVGPFQVPRPGLAASLVVIDHRQIHDVAKGDLETRYVREEGCGDTLVPVIECNSALKVTIGGGGI